MVRLPQPQSPSPAAYFLQQASSPLVPPLQWPQQLGLSIQIPKVMENVSHSNYLRATHKGATGLFSNRSQARTLPCATQHPHSNSSSLTSVTMCQVTVQPWKDNRTSFPKMLFTNESAHQSGVSPVQEPRCDHQNLEP